METYSQIVKDEIIRNELTSCHRCVKAELAAILHMAGSIHLAGSQKFSLSISTLLAGTIRRIVVLLKAAYHLDYEVRVEQIEKLGKLHRYSLVIDNQPELPGMLADLGMLTREHLLGESINSELVKSNCCRASFLRGAFLAGGSITDPQKKTYHLEMVTQHEEFADGLIYLMNLLGIKAKLSQRKSNYVVYLKESEAITRFLSWIGAHTAVIKLEEIRVMKGLRSEVNRIWNYCIYLYRKG